MTNYFGETGPYVEECYGGIDAEVSESSSVTIRAKAVGYETFVSAIKAYIVWENENGKKTIGGLPRSRVKATEIEGAEVEGKKVWDIECEHSHKKRQNQHEYPSVSFSTSTETTHITQSFETVQNVSCFPDWENINFNGVIGVTDDGPEGVDVFRPVLNYTQEVFYEVGDIDDQFVKDLANITGCVNADPFHTYNPGEVLFMGATNSSLDYLTNDDDDVFPYWRITYEFKMSPNVEGMVVGSSAPFDKKGWDYLWVYRQKITDDKGNSLEFPVQAVVEKVYPDAHLDVLKTRPLGDYFRPQE